MKDLQEGETVNITVRATLVSKPGTTSMSLTMAFEDCIAKVSDKGAALGAVGGRLGGSYELDDAATGTKWRIEPRDFWAAFQAMLAEEG
jgi:hypothetical protein